jgi:hypothetical protein
MDANEEAYLTSFRLESAADNIGIQKPISGRSFNWAQSPISVNSRLFAVGFAHKEFHVRVTC